MASHPEQHLLWVLPPSHTVRGSWGGVKPTCPISVPNTHRPLCSLFHPFLSIFPCRPLSGQSTLGVEGWRSG